MPPVPLISSQEVDMEDSDRVWTLSEGETGGGGWVEDISSPRPDLTLPV